MGGAERSPSASAAMMGFAVLCPSYELALRVENLRAARAFRGSVDQDERIVHPMPIRLTHFADVPDVPTLEPGT